MPWSARRKAAFFLHPKLPTTLRRVLQVQPRHAQLVKANMMSQLVAHSLRDLFAQQVRVVAKVPADGVAEDHDAVVDVVARHRGALVEAVGATRATTV